MKKCNKLFFKLVLAALTLFSLFLGGAKVSAASIGDVISSPENGWRRYDSTDTSRLAYEGGSWTYGGGCDYYTTNTSSRLRFKFYGTKLRLNSYSYYNHTQNGIINIDGVNYDFKQRNDVNGYHHVLDFQVTGLRSGVHSVSVGTLTSEVLSIRSIDVDSSGAILPINSNVVDFADKSVKLEKGKTIKCLPKLMYYKDSDLEWSSDNEAVANVSSDGYVYGVAKGSAVITAKVKGTSFKDSFTVNVVPTVLKFKCDYDNLSVGDTVEVNYVVDCIDNMKFTKGKIQYDKDKLELESIEPADGIVFVKRIAKDNIIDLSTSLRVRSNFLNQGQVLAKVKFKAISKGNASLKVIDGTVSNKSFVSNVDSLQLGTQSIKIS